MTYPAAVSYLLSVGQELRGVKFDLANVSRLLVELGSPHEAWQSVLVAGTNGKGSVAAMIESVLRHAGYRTGLYTSPHLARINERIRVAGEEIADRDFADLTTFVMQAVERLLARGALPGHPSFFECLTAIAFEHFRRAGCRIAALEVGMGGRLDATNVVRPLVSVITRIDFDHEAWLGNTIEQIAFEKAGILKEGGVAVSVPQRPEAQAVISRVARERNCALRIADVLPATRHIALRGRHQRENAAAAVAAVEELRRLGLTVPAEAVTEGLAAVKWPGRLEWREGRPALLLDGAHNPAGAQALRAYIEESLDGRRLVLLFGALADKAIAEMADLLFPLADAVVLTRPNQKRAATPQAIAEMAGHLNPCVTERDDPREALRAARGLAGPDGVVLVAGSLYLVGEVRQMEFSH